MQNLIKTLSEIIAKIDLIKMVERLGWHKGNETPVIPDGKTSIELVALVDYGDGVLKPRYETYKKEGWVNNKKWTIKWWSYSPDGD